MSPEPGGGEEALTVLQAMRDGLPALIVLNTALQSERDRASYPWLVTISLPLARTNATGLCDAAESERLGDEEEALLAQLNPATYRYLGRITWNGSRDILLYAAEPDKLLHTLAHRQTQAGTRPITFSKSYDPNWAAYGQFPL